MLRNKITVCDMDRYGVRQGAKRPGTSGPFHVQRLLCLSPYRCFPHANDYRNDYNFNSRGATAGRDRVEWWGKSSRWRLPLGDGSPGFFLSSLASRFQVSSYSSASAKA
jgi:hypothetical protein